MLHYVFGPVVSSRLGRSLGLDLLGKKVCTFDCLYCEVAPTARLTLERKEYIPTNTLLAELQEWLDAGHSTPDVITLGGSGEPTLHLGLQEIIYGCNSLLPDTPVAVLTNSTLLHDVSVQQALHQCDIVLPSMDTLIESEYRQLNRPHRQLSLLDMAQALLKFGEQYKGKLYLEVLLCKGINDSAANLEALQTYIAQLQPDRVDVTTLSRPGAYPEAQAVGETTLSHWRRVLGGGTHLEGRAASPKFPPAPAATSQNLEHAVLASLRRRPQTAPQLAQALQVSLACLQETLERLQHSGHIQKIGSQTDAPSHHFFSAT